MRDTDDHSRVTTHAETRERWWRYPYSGHAFVIRVLGTHARSHECSEGGVVGSVIKKRRKRMAKKKHRKLLKKTRVQRRNKK